MTDMLDKLTPGQVVPYGGDRIARVSEDLAQAFKAGDRLIVVQDSGALLHVPAPVQSLTEQAVGRARAAFDALSGVSDAAITAFFDGFAARLADDAIWARIAAANAADVEAARAKGRSTTRLVADAKMRKAMVEDESERGWHSYWPEHWPEDMLEEKRIELGTPHGVSAAATGIDIIGKQVLPALRTWWE